MQSYNWDRLGLPPSTAQKRLVELLSPDQLPSSSRLDYRENGNRVSLMLEVKDDNGQRLGAVMLSGIYPAAQHLQPQSGCAVYPRDTIYGV